MDLIEQIRRDNGIIDPNINLHPDIRSTISELRGNVERALKSLSEELYSKSTHFLLEFIQNADDNTYPSDRVPTLRLDLHDRILHIECNEAGFTPANIRAICKIGQSTKANQEGYIGEKGIGFKSVFKVADKVYISSGPYVFVFDKTKMLGMITPEAINTDSHPGRVRDGWTCFALELSAEQDTKGMVTHLQEIQPTILLFLRKLHTLNIILDDSSIQISRTDLTDGTVRLERKEGGVSMSSRFLVVEHAASCYTEERKRPRITSSKIILAFPMSEAGDLIVQNQPVHSFLPLRSYGFMADFLTASNREDILSDSQWNMTLRDAIHEAFLKAVPIFQNRPGLEHNWFQYIPHSLVDSFMGPVRASLMDALRNRSIFRCRDGKYRRSSEVIVPMSKFCDCDTGEPFIPEDFLPGLHYLSPMYDTRRDASCFQDLGIKDMSADDFICGLALTQDSFRSAQAENWHSKVCSVLGSLYYGRMKTRINHLDILPLANGGWTRASQGSIYFNSSQTDVPRDLGIAVLEPLAYSSLRYLLFEKMGITHVDPQNIARCIVDVHSRNPRCLSRSEVIAHLCYLFAHRHELNGVPINKLWLFAGDGTMSRSSDLYMDHPFDNRTTPLSDTLGMHARFLDSQLLESLSSASWEARDRYDWFHDRLGVNTTPRIIEGIFSPEVRNFIKGTDTVALLVFLRDYWYYLENVCSSELSHISSASVICSDGSRRTLNETFVSRKPLHTYPDLPFLPLQNPDDREWDFLANLGVSLNPNGLFYLKRLIELSTKPDPVDAEVIEEIYEQLEARFSDDDNADAIRGAFRSHKLIYTIAEKKPTKWVWASMDEVVWTGPPSMRSRYALETCYPFLDEFFTLRLCIPNAPRDILFQEIKPLSEQWRRKSIPKDICRRVQDILRDISALLEDDPSSDRDSSWVLKLSKEAIFPVLSPSLGCTLFSLEDKFYVPDSSGALATLFKDDIVLLDTTSGVLPFEKLKYILDARPFKDGVLYLEDSVDPKITPIGKQMPDVVCTHEFIRRVQFVERLILSSPKKAIRERRTELMQKLTNTVVYRVKSIESYYSLDNVTHNDPFQLLAIVDSTDKFTFYFCTVPPKFIKIVVKLAPFIPVDRSLLMLIFTCQMEAIEDALEAVGVANIPTEYDEVDFESWVEDLRASKKSTELVISHRNNTTKDVASTSARQGGGVGLYEDVEAKFKELLAKGIELIKEAPSQQDLHSSTFELNLALDGLSIQDDETHDSAYGNLLQSSESDSLQSESSSRPLIGSHFEYDTRISNIQAQLSRFLSGLGGGGIARLFYTRSFESASPYERYNGIVGEFFIFHVFQKNLPSFTLDNWTSELRGEIPGFQPYNQTSQVDFTYEDSAGVLTNVIFGESVTEAWKDRFPTYLLEVKTTSGSLSTPFHMSSRQLDLASKYTIRNPSKIPEHVFVLVRVSDIQSGSPGYMFYADPHRLVYDGKLRIQTNVQMEIAA